MSRQTTPKHGWYWGKIAKGSDVYHVCSADNKSVLPLTMTKDQAKACAMRHNDALRLVAREAKDAV